MKRANPKKKMREKERSQRTFSKADIEFYKNEMFWSAYELFFTCLVYNLDKVAEMNDEQIAEITDGIVAMTEEFYDRRMGLKETIEWVEKETNTELKKVFKQIRETEEVKENHRKVKWNDNR